MKYSRYAFLFPGQGSQFVGMGRDLAERFPVVSEMFREADEILGYSLSALCFDGPEDELTRTLNAQPALYVCGAAAARILKDAGITPVACAGHSLGEYTALYAAGVFDFRTGLELVKARAEAMNEAAERASGTMAAVLGLDPEPIMAICAEASQKGIVKPANFNSPGQIVISGERDGVEAAMTLAKEKGARRVVELNVSGAFHSPLMQTAADTMRKVLADASFSAPEILFINNADAAPVSDPDLIRDGLARQIVSCVRWSESMEALADNDIECFLEAGPGKVLCGLMKRILPNGVCIPCGDKQSIESVLES